MPHQLTEHISRTEELITNYEAKIATKRAARHEVEGGTTDKQQTKKLKVLKNEIIGIKKMINTLKNTLEHQRNQLDAATAPAVSTERDDIGADSDSESNSSSSSD